MHAIDRIVNNLSVEVFLMYVFIYLRLVICNENVIIYLPVKQTSLWRCSLDFSNRLTHFKPRPFPTINCKLQLIFECSSYISKNNQQPMDRSKTPPLVGFKC